MIFNTLDGNNFGDQLGIFGKSFNQRGADKAEKLFAKNYNTLIEAGLKSDSAYENAKNLLGSDVSKLSDDFIEAAESAKKTGTAITQVGTAAKTSSVAAKALSAALNMLATLAISMAITGIVKGVEYIATTQQRLDDAAQSAQESFDKENKSLEDMNDELKNTQKLIMDLEGRDLTLVEEDEYERLKRTNNELEREIKLQEARVKIAEKEARNRALDANAEKLSSNNTGGVISNEYSNRNLVNAALNTKGFDTSKYGTTTAMLSEQPDYGFTYGNYLNLNADMLVQLKKDQIQAQKIHQTAKDVAAKTGEEITESQLEIIDNYGSKAEDATNLFEGAFTVVSDRVEYLDGIIGNLSRVANPQTQQEKDFNALFDERDYLNGLLNDVVDIDAQHVSDIVLNKHSEAADKIKEIVKTYGEIGKDQLTLQFGDVVSEFEEYGWSIDSVVRHINELYAIADKPVSTIESLCSSLFKNTDAYSKLTEAMNEQSEAGIISSETYQGLIEAHEGFAELLELTADGWVLNTDSVWQFLEAQDEMTKGAALSHIQDLYEQLAENPDDTGIQNEIDRFAALIREIDSATGALSRFKKAQQTENQDADFNVGEEAYNVLNEGNKTGKVGTDEFQEAVGFMLGEDWKTTYADNIDQAYKDAEELGKRYFGQSDERTGMANFRNELVDKELGSFDGETFELFDGVTLEDTAEKLGMSYDAVKSMFGLMEAYGAEIEFPFKLTDDDIKNIEEYKENLTKEELTSGIDQLNDKAEEYQETLSTADPNSEAYAEAQEGLENVTKATEVLQGELDSISGEGVEIEPETMNLDQLYQRLQELETAVTTLQDLKITVPTEITGDIATIKQLINGKEFEKHGVLSPTDKVSPKINELETGDFESTIGVSVDPGSLSTAESALDNASRERVAKIKLEYFDPENGETSYVDSNGNTVVTEGSGNVTNTSASYTTLGGTTGTIDYTGAIDKGNSLLSIARGSNIEGIDSKVKTLQLASISLMNAFNSFEGITGPGFDPETDANAFNDAMATLTESYASYIAAYEELNTAVGEGGANGYVGVEAEEPIVEVDVEAEQGTVGNVVDTIEEGVSDNPLEMPVCIDEPKFQETVEDVTEENPATITVEPEVSPMPSLGDAGIPPQPTQIEVGADTSDGKAEIAELEGDAEDPVQKPLSIDASSAWSTLSSLVSSLTQTVTKTVRVIYTGVRNNFATGTKNAPGGLSLVDDGTGSNAGAELIVHNKQGTYELGSGDGPRVTHLDKGDTVYTAKQTKSILAKAAKVGGFFRDGLNNAGAFIGRAFATGVSGSMSWKKINQTLSSDKSYKGSTSKSRRADRGWDKYAEKLFDWIEIRLEHLKTKTEQWMLSASEAIGYISKNSELDKALSSTTQQIDETLQAYKRYIDQANTIAQKANLSADIVKKIQEGTIDIESYDDDMKNKIKAYQEWYEKAQGCATAITDLREQERELASQKLDNILDHYQWRIDRLDAVVDSNEAMIDLKVATGVRVVESDYDDSIDATNKKIKELTDSKIALSEEFANMVSKGYIIEGSELWYKYTKELENLDVTITKTKTDLQEFIDASTKIALTNLQYAMSALENSASTIELMMKLHEAQGMDDKDTDYESLIKNGMAQIKNLESQNKNLLKQQSLLDPLSEKYQKIQEEIDKNNEAILNTKVSQEQWNDSVVGLKINELEKYKTQLSKTNDEYQRQRDLQQSIEDLERARTQRTQRIFRDGLGFVFEQDQDAVLDAQKNLEDVVQSQLLGKIDELIEALEESKKDTNVYDENGVLLGKEYSLPVIESFAELFKNSGKNDDVVSAAMADARKAAYEQIFKGVTANSNQTSFQIGDIIIQNANGPEDLANAILDNFPNAIMQALYSKS